MKEGKRRKGKEKNGMGTVKKEEEQCRKTEGEGKGGRKGIDGNGKGWEE